MLERFNNDDGRGTQRAVDGKHEVDKGKPQFVHGESETHGDFDPIT